MGVLDSPIFGTPKNHKTETTGDKAVVQAPEFDVTQYAKKLAVVIGVIVPATAAALKLFKVHQITPGIVIASLGVTAAALLAVSFVMAVDLAARAYLTRTEPAEKQPQSTAANSAPSGPLVSPAKGSLVWLKDEDEPRPVLAIASDEHGAPSYLVAAGASIKRVRNGKSVEAISGAAKWHPADEISATKPGGWP